MSRKTSSPTFLVKFLLLPFKEKLFCILSNPTVQFSLTCSLFFQWSYCSLHFFARDWVVVLYICLKVAQYRWISIGLVVVQLRTVFCLSLQYLSFFCEAISWTILDSSSFSFFDSGQVFHEFVRPLTVFLPHIFFNHTAVFSFPVFFCLFHVPLDVNVDLLRFLRSFRLKSLPSLFSAFVGQIKNFFSDSGFFFFLWRCLLRISPAVSLTATLALCTSVFFLSYQLWLMYTRSFMSCDIIKVWCVHVYFMFCDTTLEWCSQASTSCPVTSL